MPDPFLPRNWIGHFCFSGGDGVLKACPYCGRVHDSREDCGRRPQKRWGKRDSRADRFRSSEAWKRKSLEIRERDRFCCQACIRNMPGTTRRIEYDGVSVHHAVPIDVDYDRRLDNDNLISLCAYHHRQAEIGVLSAGKIRAMIAEQEGLCE